MLSAHKLCSRGAPRLIQTVCRASAVRFLTISSKDYSGLFLHSTGNPGEFALSFKESAVTKGPAVIGWLRNGEDVKPSNFVDNKEFIQLMHDVVKKNLESDPELQHMAALQKTGWLHVQDYRNPAYANRIPETEDIVGSVLVNDGKLVPGSYEPMPVHRLVTMNGLFKLNKPLHDALVKAVTNVN